MRYLKWAGIVVGCLLLTMAGFVFYIGYALLKPSPKPQTPVAKPKFFAEAPPKAKKSKVQEPKSESVPNPDLPLSAGPAPSQPEEKPEKKKRKHTDAEILKFADSMARIAEDPNPDFQACSVECADIRATLKRSYLYLLEGREADYSDPAYHLVRMNLQATFGPEGTLLLGFMRDLLHFHKEPEKLMALWKDLGQIKESVRKLKERERAKEASALERWLIKSGKSCEQIDWHRECAKIQYEIDGWIADGALN